MPEVIAVKALKYPRPIAAGERFIASDRQAKVLKAMHKVVDAPERQPPQTGLSLDPGEPSDPNKPRRRYNRRDLQARES